MRAVQIQPWLSPLTLGPHHHLQTSTAIPAPPALPLAAALQILPRRSPHGLELAWGLGFDIPGPRELTTGFSGETGD